MDKQELTLAGALWLNASESGRRYLAGNFDAGETRYRILVFKNDKDPESKKPDYRIMLQGTVPKPEYQKPKPPPGANSDDDFSF